MKYLKILLFVLLGMTFLISCSDDDEIVPEVNPSSTGKFIDNRDNYEYHWVNIGNLDWVIENSHFFIEDDSKCRFYVPYEDLELDEPSDKTSNEFGYLYSIEGAKECVPEGWRLPTDDDWKNLESALGMSLDETNQREWRGTFVGTLLQQKDQGTQLGLQLGGYYTTYLGYYDPHYWHNGTYGYYWSSTTDSGKKGEYIFYRKISYNSSKVYRESIEPKEYMLSVRFVRDR